MRSGAALLFCSLCCVSCGSSSSNDAPVNDGADGSSDGGVDGASDAPSESSGCAVDTSPKPNKVVVESGALVGATSGGSTAFLGIPYAAPPVGDLRWKPPQPAACWSAERAANAFGSICLQQTSAGAVTGSEDCLTLNVWTPSDAPPSASLPVLVFVHGGANIAGSSADTTTDGSHLYDGAALAAARHAVVVTMNYRVAAMGFFAHAGLDAERPEGASGDWALLDQIAALQWVQRNAHVFGGDATHVLLFGESAGATNVGLLYASPLAKGLFSAVAIESGNWSLQAHADALTYGQKLVSGASCAKSTDADTIACLRALPAEQIAKALPQSFDLSAPTAAQIFQPTIEGWVVPEDPIAHVAAGKHNAVPLLLGSNAQEISAYLPPAEMTDAEYRAHLLALASGSTTAADALYAQYPPSDWGGSPRAAYVACVSDVLFTCPTRRLARAAVKGQSQPVHRYFFTHALQNAGPAVQAIGAFHGLELAFVFRHLAVNGYTPTSGESALGDAMDDAWTKLASSGDVGDASWPSYDATTDPYVQLEVPIASGAGVRSKQCDFWDTVAAAGK